MTVDGLAEHFLNERDGRVTRSIMEMVRENSVVVDGDFENRVASAVGRLHDEGVEIGGFIGSSRRVVFEGRYRGNDVVIKFSHSKRTLEHDERQQQQEESIWMRAKETGYESYFAKIYFGDINFSFVVQERCEDVRSMDYEDLPLDFQEVADKFGFSEIEIGYVGGQMKFVDYGW